MKKSSIKFLKNDLSLIEIDKEVILKLNNAGIKNIGDLCKTNRKALNNFGFNTYEINHIIVNLQLSGLDLSKKQTLLYDF